MVLVYSILFFKFAYIPCYLKKKIFLAFGNVSFDYHAFKNLPVSFIRK